MKYITPYKKYNESFNKMSNFRSTLPKSIIELNELFESNNRSLYVVGGSIRDYIMGDTPHDFDLCTNATPNEIMEITKSYRKNMQGSAFGVIVVYTKDNSDGYEIATFRSDIYDGKLGDTRNPDIVFSTIEEDANRRDLSINALYYNISTDEIIDYHNGISDLKNGIVRMVGDPKLRILEDKLRILRCLRFAARYNYKIEKNTYSAIRNGNLKNISKERIWSLDKGEVPKAFEQVKDISIYIKLLIDTGVIKMIFDGFNINLNIEDHKYLESYIADFLSDNIDVQKIVQYLKIENDIAKKASFLIKMRDMTAVDAYQLLKMKKILNISNDLIFDFFNKNMKDVHKKFMIYKPSVSSKDLIDRGFIGKQLGNEIQRLEIINFEKINI